MKFDFGLVGLGVMGRNFILNVAEKGYSSIGLSSSMDSINILKNDGADYNIEGTTSDKKFIESLTTPRKIMLLVPAGEPVDSMIERLLPYLKENDLIVDGGNSHFDDTERRYNYLKKKNINFLGAGVSGGSRGARNGPSIMPGGSKESYALISKIFEDVSAKVGKDACVEYLGGSSSGHYVKMIHNGIEYAIMQLISEVYNVLKIGLNKNNKELSEIFTDWNNKILDSYLLEITGDIFNVKDDETGNYLVDQILDKAKQKGTGKWTSQSAMDLGVSIPTIDSSVSMRIISSFKELRQKASDIYASDIQNNMNIDEDQVEKSLIFSFIISFAQGLSQLQIASKEKSYDLNLESICRIWRGGCIIRAGLLENFMAAFKKNPKLENLLFDPEIAQLIKDTESAAREVSIFCINSNIPAYGLLSSLSYFDSLKSSKLPMNLVQAQRDCFGEHTFERIDKSGFFHHNKWQSK